MDQKKKKTLDFEQALEAVQLDDLIKKLDKYAKENDILKKRIGMWFFFYEGLKRGTTRDSWEKLVKSVPVELKLFLLLEEALAVQVPEKEDE